MSPQEEGMREFQVNAGTAAVNGKVVETYMAAMGPYAGRGEQVLKRNLGVEKLVYDGTTFYPLDQFLKTLEEFQAQLGQPFLKAMGKFVLTKAEFPPDITSLEQALSMLNIAYYMNHQCAPGDIGSYRWQQVSDRGGVMTCDNPYPCAFDQGLLETLAARFAPGATVAHDPADGCRHQRGDACAFTISW
jgi:hypothetical protein